MLESLGYAEAPARADADLILFNTCSIRESADIALRRAPRRGQAPEARGPGPRGRRRRLLGAVGQGRGLRAASRSSTSPSGPGQVHRLAEFLTVRLAHRAGLLRVRGLHRPPARQAGARAPGVGADLGRLQLRVLLLHRALHPRARGQPRRRRARRRGRAPGRPTACARSRCSGRTSTPTAATCARACTVRRAAARASTRSTGIERIRYTSPHPKDIREDVVRAHAELAVALRAHPPAAPVGLLADPQGDAPHLHARALPRPGAPDPRARARLRDHRPTSSSASRGRPRRTSRRRWRSSRRSATTAPSRSSSPRAAAPRRPTLPDQVPHPVKVERMQRLVEVVQRRAHERAQRFVGRSLDVLVEGPSRNDPR